METNNIRILLVEDHQMMREGVRRMLSEHPGLHVVGEADCGSSALAQVRTSKPDVVVMDIHMPGGCGIETSTRILAEFPAVRIVVLSADTDLATVQRALRAGVSGYITKDSPSKELVRAIREAVDRQVYLSPEVAAIIVQDYMKLMVDRSAPARPMMTDRDRTLLKLVAEGKRNKEIAETLQVGVKSVETYRSRLMRKLDCASTAELTRYAIRAGITTA